MPFRPVLVGIFLCLALCRPALGQELEARAEIDRYVMEMFGNSRFAELEARAAHYRETEAQTSSGLQMLNVFYFGLRDAVIWQFRFPNSEETTLRMADEWMAAYPSSPTAVIAKATILHQNALAARRGSPGRTEDRIGQGPFFELARRADAVLLDAKHYAAVDPHWYTLRARILLTLGAEPDVFAAHMEEGLDLYPGYYELYFAAINYLSPHWRGNRQMIENFADGMVARTRDIEGEGMYARIYWYASQVIYGSYLFLESDLQWDRMRVGIWDVVDRYPDQWNIQNFAFFACLAEDAKTLADLMAMMDGPPIMRVWKNEEVLVYCKDLAAPI